MRATPYTYGLRNYAEATTPAGSRRGVGCLERRGLGGKSARVGGKLAWPIPQSAQVAEKLIAIR